MAILSLFEYLLPTINCYHLLGFILGIITTFAFVWAKFGKEECCQNDSLDKKDSYCSSPSCVRCSRFRHVLSTAASRLEDLISSIPPRYMSRLKKAIRDQSKILQKNKETLLLQQPNVLYVPGLTAKPFWDLTYFTKINRLLTDNFDVINKEFCHVYARNMGWKTNSVPSGHWHMFHFINQGVSIDENCVECPVTFGVLNKMDKLMENNLFGNAMFSVTQPGTQIASHCGPCNFRVRCHLSLLAPQCCSITVGSETRKWEAKECLFFDDSFYHEVKHPGTLEDGPRAVLLLDLWHPDLTEKEIDILDYIFSSGNDGGYDL